MADSVRELIMKHVKTTLEGITVANGYVHTLQAVERLQQQGQSSQSPMAVILEGDDRPIDLTSQDAGGLAIQRELEVGIVLDVVQDEEIDARSASEVMNDLVADVQKAMQVDVSRGGHAIDTEELGIDPILIVDAKKKLLCPMGYRIRYRHLRTDPRTNV